AVYDVLRVVEHPPVQMLLAADQLAASLRDQKADEYLCKTLPRDLIQTAAEVIAGEEGVLLHLRAILKGDCWSCQPMAARLLHAVDSSWRPDPEPSPLLVGAYLDGADWPGVRLAGNFLDNADLGGANLQKADLTGAALTGANLERADLSNAVLSECEAW